MTSFWGGLINKQIRNAISIHMPLFILPFFFCVNWVLYVGGWLCSAVCFMCVFVFDRTGWKFSKIFSLLLWRLASPLCISPAWTEDCLNTLPWLSLQISTSAPKQILVSRLPCLELSLPPVFIKRKKTQGHCFVCFLLLEAYAEST